MWGAPASEKPSLATSSNHLTSTSLNPNIIKSSALLSTETSKPAQPPIQEYSEIAESFQTTEEPTQPPKTESCFESPLVVVDDTSNFPSLDSFPSLSSKANTAPTRGKGKKGKGRKGQQVLTLGVQRMSIN